MVLTRDGLIRLLKEALWNRSPVLIDIYEEVYDIMHNGTENDYSEELLNFEKVADDILYEYGVELDDAVPMTVEQISAELGYKVVVV